MDITLLERLITSVGFPIVMCIVLAYYIIKLMDKQTQELKELRKAINDNTNALGQMQTVFKLFNKDGK